MTGFSPVSRGNDNQESLKMIIGESRLLFDEASSNFLKMAEFNRLGAEAASVRGDQLYVRLARVKIVSICLIALVITLLVIYIIIAIDKPVKAIVEGTRRVSNGDLDVYLPYDSEDEIGILTDSVNQLIERLKNIIDDEKYLFREIGSENFEVKSTCEQAYRGILPHSVFDCQPDEQTGYRETEEGRAEEAAGRTGRGRGAGREEAEGKRKRWRRKERSWRKRRHRQKIRKRLMQIRLVRRQKKDRQENDGCFQTKKADFHEMAGIHHITPVTARIIRNRDIVGAGSGRKVSPRIAEGSVQSSSVKGYGSGGGDSEGKDSAGKTNPHCWRLRHRRCMLYLSALPGAYKNRGQCGL